MYVIVEPTSCWNEDDLRIFYDAVRECEFAILSDTEVKRQIEQDLDGGEIANHTIYTFRVPKHKVDIEYFAELLDEMKGTYSIKTQIHPPHGFREWMRSRKARKEAETCVGKD